MTITTTLIHPSISLYTHIYPHSEGRRLTYLHTYSIHIFYTLIYPHIYLYTNLSTITFSGRRSTPPLKRSQGKLKLS